MQGIKQVTQVTNRPPRIITDGPLGKTWFVGSFIDEDSTHRCAAYWKNERWNPLPVRLDRNSFARDLTLFGDTVYVGGSFTILGFDGDTTSMSQITGLIKVFDDSIWYESPMKTFGVDEFFVSGDSLFVYGAARIQATDTIFTLFMTPDRGATWQYPFNPVHPTGEPSDFNINIKLAVHEGSVYITNNNDSLGSPHRGITRWDGQQWHPLDKGTPGFNSKVWDLAFYQDDLYIGGNFNNNIYPNDPGESFARWNEQSQSWEDVGGGVKRIIETFLVRDSLLYAISGSNRFGDAIIPFLAAWDGEKWCGTPQTWYPNPPIGWFLPRYAISLFQF